MKRFAVYIVKASTECPGEVVACDLNIKRKFAPAHELVGDTVGCDLHPLAANAITVRGPDPFSVAVDRGSVAGIRIGLLHGSVCVEDIHVLMERRPGILDKPGSDDRI